MKIYNIKISTVGHFFTSGKSINSLLKDNTHQVVNITKHDLKKKSKLTVNQSWHKKKYGFEIPKNEISIFRMHRTAWELFDASGEGFCLIVQDDLNITKPCNDIINVDTINEYWDIIFPFESDTILTKDDLTQMKILNKNTREERDYDPYLLGKQWCSSIYFLSKTGCTSLLSIKEISQTFIDEILLQSMEGKISVFCKKFPWFIYEIQPATLNLEREKEIYKAIYKRSMWNARSLSLIRDILSALSKLATAKDIDLILQGGTHLGYIQHGGIMPWDDDVDIGIHSDNLDIFLSALKGESTLRISQHIEESSNKLFYKIWSKKGLPIAGQNYTFPFVDLWVYNIEGADFIFLNGIICPNANKEKLKQIIFEGSRYKIPFNSVECLDARYKTWKYLIRVYRWSHKKEGAYHYPLKLHIKTNKTGKIIGPLFEILEKRVHPNTLISLANLRKS